MARRPPRSSDSSSSGSSSTGNTSHITTRSKSQPASASQSISQPTNTIFKKPNKRKRADTDPQNSYRPSSQPPDTPSPSPRRGRRISKRERSALKPTGPSERRPLDLPLDLDEIDKAQRAVRRHNDKFGIQLRDYGLTAVVDLAYNESRNAGHPFFQKKPYKKRAYWRQHGLNLLASSPETLLECFLGEGIAPSVSNYTELSELYDASGDETAEHSAWIQRYNQAFSPCHYVRELVDKEGEPPTPTELLKIIQMLRDYVGGNEKYACRNAKIDCVSRKVDTTEQDINDGYHYFLDGKENRARNIITFCTALEQRIAKLDPNDYNVSMPWTLKYVGYARTAADRFKSYSEDRAQNWFIELTRNVSQVAFPKRSFQIDTHVIYFCTCLEECQIGEELLSRCGQAYLETGSGFGVTPAGLSNQPANTTDFTHGKALELWEMTLRFRLHNYDFFSRNMDREAERMAEYEEYLQLLRSSAMPSTQDVEDAAIRKDELREENAQLTEQLEGYHDKTKPLHELQEMLGNLREMHTNLETDIQADRAPLLQQAASLVHSHQANYIRQRLDILGPSPQASSQSRWSRSQTL